VLVKLHLSLAFLAAAALSSCGIEQAAAPMKPTAFLTSTGTDVTKKIARLPFDHSWRDPAVDITKYKNIVVRPVTVRYLQTENWERSRSAAIPNQKAFEKRASELARHFSRQLDIAFSDPICVYYKTSNTSKPGTLILEVALTDAHFPDSAVATITDVPVCAFEARVRDAGTGKLVSTAADRRGPDLHISENGTHITGTKEICSIWARQLMEASNKEIFANVRRKLITIDEEHP